MRVRFTSRALIIMMVVTTLLVTGILASGVFGTEVYKIGSSGDTVGTIQTKLKRWGYYQGAVDGKYGAGTRNAVVKFQQKNKLRVDGAAGKQTLEAMGIFGTTKKPTTGKNTVTQNEKILLAKAITGEARGEPYAGQVAVGGVILNRVKNPEFPNSISGVIYEPWAFTAVQDGQINLEPTASCLKAAEDALNGWDPTEGCLYYWNPATATSKWIWSRDIKKIIGKHYFGI